MFNRKNRFDKKIYQRVFEFGFEVGEINLNFDSFNWIFPEILAIFAYLKIFG